MHRARSIASLCLHVARRDVHTTGMLVHRLHTSGMMGTPTCVNRIVLNETEQVMYGDSLGMVNMILADTTESFKSRDLLYTEHTQDYVCLHDKHEDWVTKVCLANHLCDDQSTRCLHARHKPHGREGVRAIASGAGVAFRSDRKPFSRFPGLLHTHHASCKCILGFRHEPHP